MNTYLICIIVLLLIVLVIGAVRYCGLKEELQKAKEALYRMIRNSDK